MALIDRRDRIGGDVSESKGGGKRRRWHWRRSRCRRKDKVLSVLFRIRDECLKWERKGDIDNQTKSPYGMANLRPENATRYGDVVH